MKRLLLFLAIAGSAHAAGSVQQNLQLLSQNAQGIATSYVLSFYWTGDSITGTVPNTAGQGLNCCTGFFVNTVETVPGSPSPTNNYGVALQDSAGVDVLGGTASALSNVNSQSFAASASAPPIQGAITLVITGQAVASAKGTVFVFLQRPGFVNSASLNGNTVIPIIRGGTGQITQPNALTALLGSSQVPAPNGGTGVASPTAHTVPVAEGTSPFAFAAPGAANQILVSNGASADPTFQPITTSVLPAGTQTQQLRIQPNTGNNTTLQFASPVFVNAGDYNFPAQSPGGSLSVGANTITLTPCPLGLNGADSAHNIYISGGVGAAEAVTITGGSCTSGASSGTVSFSAGNTHSGAWTVTSVGAGLPEADIALGANGGVLYLNTNVSLQGTITLGNPLTLQCSPGITITWAATAAANMFVVATNNVNIRDCVMSLGTASSAIGNSGTRSNINIVGNQMSGGAIPINVTAGTNWYVAANIISGFTNTGINFATSVNLNYIRIENNYVNSAGSTVVNGGGIAAWGSHTAIVGNTVVIGGNKDQGIFWANTVGNGLTDGVISGNTIQSAGTGALECIGIGGADRFSVTGNSCKATTTSTNTAFDGIEVNRCNYGAVSGNAIDLGLPTASVAAAGILLESTTYVAVTGNSIAGWGPGNSSLGIDLVLTVTGTSLSFNTVSSNTLNNNAATGGTAGDIQSDSLTTGVYTSNVIENNMIEAQSTASHICIKVLNSGAATTSLHRITGNTIDTCDTGIQDVGTNNTLDNNRITNAATANYSDLGTTSKMVDFASGVPFAFLGAQQNGSVLYCTNCTIANPCAAAGTGAIAKRLNGIWVCN